MWTRGMERAKAKKRVATHDVCGRQDAPPERQCARGAASAPRARWGGKRAAVARHTPWYVGGQQRGMAASLRRRVAVVVEVETWAGGSHRWSVHEREADAR